MTLRAYLDVYLNSLEVRIILKNSVGKKYYHFGKIN
jgi:hypothetical protein